MQHFPRPTEGTFFGTPAEMLELALTQGAACLPEGATLQNDGTALRHESTWSRPFNPVAVCVRCGRQHRHHDVFVTAQGNVFGGGCLHCNGRLDVCRWEE